MRERPILFSGEMVRAILEGRKTQTRRVVKPQPTYHYDHWQFKGAIFHTEGMTEWLNTPYPNGEKCPYGVAGDRLWVREKLRRVQDCDACYPLALYDCDRAQVRFPNGRDNARWEWKRSALPSIHMPRWASRITLEIVKVRVERLQEISNNDALAEGTPDIRTIENNYDLRDCYRKLWNKINGAGAWDKNPWVWVIEFKPV